MTIPTYRTAEPLYIVIVRNNDQAETILKTWVKENRVDHVHITGNRMMLHDQSAFQKFCITWSYSPANTMVWDTWNRRHIYLT